MRGQCHGRAGNILRTASDAILVSRGGRRGYLGHLQLSGGRGTCDIRFAFRGYVGCGLLSPEDVANVISVASRRMTDRPERRPIKFEVKQDRPLSINLALHDSCRGW